MRNLRELDRYRVPGKKLFGWDGDDTCGAFLIPGPKNSARLMIIASSGLGWDHVSVSLATRCPTWAEMEHVKRLFFRPEEVVMQLHVAEAEHINVHPHTLHLWRPQDREIPLPPRETI